MKKLFFILPMLFNANLAFGYATQTVIDRCGTTNNPIYAVFEPFEYTCANGFFLPADTLGCTVCPIGATCNGGTYKYSETNMHGAIYTDLITQNQTNICSANSGKLFAQFDINTYTCATGYYLPAGVDWLTDNDGCTLCPNDSYCGGGTYTFSETTTQGITACGAGLFAPAGMWEPEQCGRILHVGDGFVYLRSTKITEHALHVDLDHDGIADYFGNMTTLDVPMSRDTPRKLKVRMNGIVYSIYDDSVDLSLYENE